MTNPTLPPRRRTGRLLAVLALLPALVSLAACDSEQANELTQSGTWHVGRMTATTYRNGQPPTTVTVADPGDFAFEDHAASFNRVVFYVDKTVPSRALGRFIGTSGLAPRRYDWFWEADPGPARRLLLRRDETQAATFTYDEYGPDRETFFYVERDNQNNIGYREDWELTRTH